MGKRFAVRAIKKMAAVSAGLTMVGATFLGAAAADLSEYPSPFVTGGKLNAILVVGENAATIDSIGVANIQTGLQYSAAEPAGVAGSPRGGSILSLSGDAVEIGDSSDLLEIGENIGNVRETVTEFELDALKGGVITTDEGSTEYNQYLRFEETSPAIAAGSVIYGENDERNEKVGDFLKFTEGNDITEAMFEYELEFEEGLESEIEFNIVGSTVSTTAGILDDLEDEVFNIFGVDYTFVDSKINLVTETVQLEFLGGDVVDTMEEGEVKEYVIDGVTYVVEVLIIADNKGPSGTVKFKINGEVSDELEDGETDVLSDGLEIGIRAILPNEAEEVSGGDLVEFFLGANKVTFKDVGFTDTSFTQGVEITEEDIEEGFVQIRGAVTADNSTFEISSIKYRLVADARSGESDIYIAPGHGLREYLDEPEGMLNPEWDIRYEGLVDTGVSTVIIDANGDDEYNIKFTNRQGNAYSVPFVDHQGTFKLGEDTDNNAINDLIFVEGVINTDSTGCTGQDRFFNIKDDDYFIISNMDDEWDETAFSHVLRYESIDTSNRELTFEDLATGTQEITYSADSTIACALGKASLIVGGNTYDVYVHNSSTAGVGGDAFALAIDMNNDGDVGNNSLGISYIFGVERAKITFDGGGILDLENFNYTNILSGNTSLLNFTGFGIPNVTRGVLPAAPNQMLNSTLIDGTYLCSGGVTCDNSWANNISDTFNLTLHTESSEFDENDGDEEIRITIESKANNEVGLNVIETEFRLSSAGAYTCELKGDCGAAGGVVAGTPTAGLYDFELNEPDENEDFNLGMTAYGILFSVFDEDSSDEPEELTLEYPLIQRGAHVFVTAGDISSSRLGASSGAVILNKIDIGKTLLDSEVADVTSQNAIVVGGPCVNSAAADLLGNPADCAEGFTAGTAMLKLFQNGNNVALLVAGYSGEDTRRAANILAEYDKYDLMGMEASIDTQTLRITKVQ